MISLLITNKQPNMKPHITPHKINPQMRTKPNALKRVASVLAVTACIATLKVSAAPITLVSENFDSYTGAATSFSSIAVAVPNTDYIRIEDGLAQADAPSGLGFNGVQLVSGWFPSSAYNSGNAMLLRPNTAFRCNLDPRGGTNYVWEFSMLSSKSGSADRGFRPSILEEGADQNEQDSVIFRSGQASTTNNLAQPGGINVDGVDIIQAFNGFNAASGVPLPNQWVTMSNTVAGTPVFVTNNVWAHYKIVLNAVTRKFDFYVNDMVTPKSTGNAAARPQNLPITAVRFAHEGNSADDGYTLIDNVSLTVDGNFISLANGTFTEGFEGYTASNSGNTNTADNNPGGAWVTAETTGVANNNTIASNKVQVVDASVSGGAHTGNNCLMVSQGQTAGSTISWGQATNEDVRITWWAKVPATPFNNAIASVYLRVSVYAWEADYSSASDTILFGYGHRNATPFGSTPTSIMTFSRWFNEWFNNGSWGDTLQTYTADTWEEYQLTTNVKLNSYTLVKNPSSTPVVVVKDGKYISSWGNNKKFHTIAFSTSNNSAAGGNPPAFVDDITIEPYTNTENPDTRPYTPTITGSRFTNYTVLTIPGKTIGGVTVDPTDNTSILFTIDEERVGQVRRATKVASGNWVVDSTPVISGLYNPNACIVETNGTLWVVRDNVKGGQGCALLRLKQPWATSPVEEVISDFSVAPVNQGDQPCDLAFVPASWGGTYPQLAVLDRGVNNNNNPNAIWLVDPATATLNQATYNNFLVAPSTIVFGAGLTGNANAIAALPGSGELVTIWEDGISPADDGVIMAWDSTGASRQISTMGSGVNWGAGIAVDPTTSRIWVSDRNNTTAPSAFNLPKIVSFDTNTVAAGSPNASFIQELTFPNIAPTADRPDRHIDFKEPGMAFSPNGSFLAVADQSLVAGGSRIVIFHSEPFVVPPITITSVTRSGGNANLVWTSGGAVNYVVQRSATVNGTYTSVSGILAGTTFTDTTAPAGNAFYKVVAFPQN